ncbi:hypothetical protein Peur_010738 [Populus x canadensis]
MIKIFTIVQMQICFVAFFLLPCPCCLAFVFAPPWVTDGFRPDPRYFDLPVGFLGSPQFVLYVGGLFLSPVASFSSSILGFFSVLVGQTKYKKFCALYNQVFLIYVFQQ